MSKNQRGFTIIELIVVIAIIAVLAAIVLTNVSAYQNKAKVAREKADINNIEKALDLFYSQYGTYPACTSTSGPSGSNNNCTTQPSSYGVFDVRPIIAGGGGDPYATIDSTNHYLSELYKLDWNSYNATYLAPDAFYNIRTWAIDEKTVCGEVDILGSNGCEYGIQSLFCSNPSCPCYTFILSATPHGCNP